MQHPLSRTSVTIDEAIAYLLGMIDGPVVFQLPNPDCTSEEEAELENISYDLNEVLRDDYDAAVSDHAEAKLELASTEKLTELTLRVDAERQKIVFANQIRCAIEDELLKQGAGLRIDTKISLPHLQYVSLASLEEWSIANPTIARIKRELLPAVSEDNLSSDQKKPWEQKVEADPEPQQPWYTAARHFARTLIATDPTLQAKRRLLAEKVAERLSAHNITKRGGVKSLEASTIQKAFTNVQF